mgnify:CR=1 FL=1
MFRRHISLQEFAEVAFADKAYARGILLFGGSKDNNVLYVSHGDESPLYSHSCFVGGLNWIGYEPRKFRYAVFSGTLLPRRRIISILYLFDNTAAEAGGFIVKYGVLSLGNGALTA